MGEKNTHTYQCKCLKIVETQCKNQGISNMVKKEACTKCCEGCQNNDGGVAKRCEFCGAVRGAVTLFLSPLLFSFFSCMKVEGCRAVLLSCLEAQAVVRLAQFPDVLLVGRVSVETFCSRLANDLPTRGARGGSRRVENPSLHHSVYC